MRTPGWLKHWLVSDAHCGAVQRAAMLQCFEFTTPHEPRKLGCLFEPAAPTAALPLCLVSRSLVAQLAEGVEQTI